METIFHESWYALKFISFAFLTACALPFLDYCMASPSRILGWYRLMLMENALQRGNPALLDAFRKETVQPILGESDKGFKARKRAQYFSKVEQHGAQYIFWEKPLGACMVCFSPYLSWIVFFMTGLQSDFGSWWSYTLPLWFAVFVSYIYKRFTNYT